MEILEIPLHREYPTEYLIGRIRGRRGALIRDWDHIACEPDRLAHLLSSRYGMSAGGLSDDGIWKSLFREYRWAWYQMNGTLRTIFAPFFISTEIHTIIMCLRHKMTRAHSHEAENILLDSLLSQKVKRLLSGEKDVLQTLDELEAGCLSRCSGMTPLREAYADGGLKGVEQRLRAVCLGHIISPGLHPVMKRYFSALIDSTNIMAAYKHLRWGIPGGPPLLPGGAVRSGTLASILKTGDLGRLVERHTGSAPVKPDGTGIDRALRKGLSKRIHWMSREISGIGLILDYLWRCGTEAKNLSLLIRNWDTDRNVLAGELTV